MTRAEWLAHGLEPEWIQALLEQAALVTDAKWHVTDPPVTAEHLYHGESYDARLELPGWDQLGYATQDASGNWSAAEVIEPPLGKDAVLVK